MSHVSAGDQNANGKVTTISSCTSETPINQSIIAVQCTIGILIELTRLSVFNWKGAWSTRERERKKENKKQCQSVLNSFIINELIPMHNLHHTMLACRSNHSLYKQSVQIHSYWTDRLQCAQLHTELNTHTKLVYIALTKSGWMDKPHRQVESLGKRIVARTQRTTQTQSGCPGQISAAWKRLKHVCALCSMYVSIIFLLHTIVMNRIVAWKMRNAIDRPAV